MSRRISLYILLGTVVAIGVLFYQVIQPFVFALLFAIVLAVLFRPAYDWLTERMGGGHYRRLLAALMTLAILLLILLPIGVALVVAGAQLVEVSRDIAILFRPDELQSTQDLSKLEQSEAFETLERMYYDLDVEQREQINAMVSRAADGVAREVYNKTVGLLGDVINFVIGLAVTGLALYYFLADGDRILYRAKELTPLDDEEENALIEQFGKVCRGVVMGTVVAALAQAILAGIGFTLASVPNVLLLTATALFFSFIPFVGAGSVVTVVAIWLAVEDRYWASAFLLAYCFTIVTTSDNVIRAYVIGSQAKMNPLVAFITVVGALQLIGLWGIFIGPMIAALFYTLLQLLHDRIVRERQAEERPAAA